MGVYIKGMEIPKSCSECRFYGEYCYAKGDEDVHSDIPCPIVPVPKHGRLIDADAMSAKDNNDFSVAVDTAVGFAAKQLMIMAHAQLQKAIEIQPTIIPAEEV